MTEGGSVDPDAPLRLFLALDLPATLRVELAAWGERHVGGGRHVRADDLHVTLAFLGRRHRSELEAVVATLRDAAAEHPVGPLELRRWRETGRVGMLVLADPTGGATRLQRALRERLEAQGALAPSGERWLPHVTLVRFDHRPRARPPLPDHRTFVPSDAGAYLSRTAPTGARYEALARVPLRTTTDDTTPRAEGAPGEGDPRRMRE